MDCKSIDEFSSPLRKLVLCFKTGRDSWKGKHQTLKMQCKLLENQNRAVEKSREQWRERSLVAEKLVKELELELQRSKKATLR